MEARDFFAGLVFINQIDKLKFSETGLIELDSLGDIPENCYEMADIMLEAGGKSKTLEIGDIVKYTCRYAEEDDKCHACSCPDEEGIIESIRLRKCNGESFVEYVVNTGSKVPGMSKCTFLRKDLVYAGFEKIVEK